MSKKIRRPPPSEESGSRASDPALNDYVASLSEMVRQSKVRHFCAAINTDLGSAIVVSLPHARGAWLAEPARVEDVFTVPDGLPGEGESVAVTATVDVSFDALSRLVRKQSSAMTLVLNGEMKVAGSMNSILQLSNVGDTKPNQAL